jgi:putative tryptophan/tyrosine transport system substrate-binding protein
MRRREFIVGSCGAVGAWPLRAPAQQRATVKRIGLAHPVALPEQMNEKGDQPFYRAFFTELRRLGYVESENIVVERRSGEGRPERYSEIARDLVGLNPDVIVVNSARTLAYFREATKTIPIIAITGDPVLFGIVANIARPEGNVTGFSADASIEIHGKYLEMLKQLRPGLTKVGLLTLRLSWDPYIGPLQAIANRMGLNILGPPVENPVEEPQYRRAVAAMISQGAEGLLVTAGSENFTYRRLIVELAEKNRLAAIYPFVEFARLGGLIAYAVDLADIGMRTAGYVHKVLQGARPSELPYQMPTKLQLIINVRTAKALDLTVPPNLLTLADEAIE